MDPLVIVSIAFVVLFFFAGIRIVRPTHRALVERLGKYHHFASFGFNWIIPGIDRMFIINITEKMINAEASQFKKHLLLRQEALKCHIIG